MNVLRRRLLVLLAGVLVLVAIVVAYGSVHDSGLVWDDHYLVDDGAHHRTAPLGALFLRSYWPDNPLTDARPAYYRPLVLLSVRFDLAGGASAAQMHLTNVVAHLLACTLLALVAWRLGASSAAAVLAALAWGVAPRLTEDVAWISGRTDVLAGLFALAAVAASPDVAPRGPPRRPWLWSAASAVLLLLALFAKEVALAAGVVLIVAAVTRPERTRGDLVRAAVAVGAPLAIYGALRVHAVGVGFGAARSVPLGTRVLTVLEACGRYVAMSVDALRPRTSIGFVGEPDLAYVALGALAIVGGGLLAWHRRRRAPRGVVLAAVLGLAALLPVVQIAPLALSGAIVSDRLLYLPLAGLAIAIAVALRSAKLRVRLIASGVVLLGSIVFASRTYARTLDYGDEVRFWLVATEKAHPHNTAPRTALAAVVRDGGRVDLGCRLFEEARHIQERIGDTTRTIHQRTRENLAACWARDGRYTEALREYQSLVAEHPTVARIHMGLGYVQMHRGEWADARAELLRAQELDPRLAREVRRPLAILVTAPRHAEAFATEESRARDPLGWANFLADVGRAREAASVLVVIAHDPKAPPAARTEAIGYLLDFGTVAEAEAAIEANPDLPARDRGIFDHILGRRQQKLARIVALQPRIEALATPP